MKTAVLDTNVLLDRPFPQVLSMLEEDSVVIPFPVLEELDTFKDSVSKILRNNSRSVSRGIDMLRSVGNVHEGIRHELGHLIRVEINHVDYDIAAKLPHDDTDTRIIKVAKSLKDKGEDVTLYTQDVNQRILADIVGVDAKDFGEELLPNKLYSGFRYMYLPPEDMERLSLEGSIEISEELYENEFVVASSATNPKSTILAIYNQGQISKTRNESHSAYGISPKNLEQRLFMDALMNPNIKLVTATGPAGTGKTLLALAAALNQKELDIYKRIMVSRSPIEVGRKQGFLPGDELEKIAPWLKSVQDNLEFILESKDMNKEKDDAKWMMEFYNIEMQALTYIRGRSIPRQLIIIDEGQNLNRHEIKTIISRAGEDTKIVVLGDIFQIDNPRLSTFNNGLVHLINNFKDDNIHAHVTLEKTERSELAEKAAERL